MKIFPGAVIIKRHHKGHGKPKHLIVLDQDCDQVFIRLETPDGNTIVMPKHTIPLFYDNVEQGTQGELFEIQITRLDLLRKKHLKDVG